MFFECDTCHKFCFKDGEDPDRARYAQQLEEAALKDAYNALVFDATPESIQNILSGHGQKSFLPCAIHRNMHKIYSKQDSIFF